MKTRRAQSVRSPLATLFAPAAIASLLLLTACGGGGGAAPSPGLPPLTITNSSLPDGFTGAYYEQVLRATGGTPPYEWSASSLPPGLSIAQGTDWLILGYPTQTGIFTPTVQVSDSKYHSAKRTLTLIIKEGLRIINYAFPNGRVNRPYSYTLEATGGQPPYTWSLESGYTLPPGLNLSSSGTVGGTPAAGGNYVFGVKVHDSGTQFLNATVFLFIEALHVTPTYLPPAHLDEPYSATLQAEWGDPPFTWSLEPGSSLPPGLSLNDAGVVSGTPTVSGNYNFSVKVQDATSQIATSWLFLAVLTPLTITTTALPDGNVAADYWTHLEATGGWGYYYWSLEPGSTLPQGIYFDAGGYIGGTPTEAGTFNLTVHATDGDQTAAAALSLFIDNRLAILTRWLREGVVTGAYSSIVEALGGTLPYRWAITGGTAGPDFTIDPGTGEIRGTPTQVGDYTITVQVTDSSVPAQIATWDFGLRVRPAPTFVTTSLPDGAQGAQYSTCVQVEGGMVPLTVRLVEGSLPGGLRLSDPQYYGCLGISGTPAAAGTYNFTLEIADSSPSPVTARQAFTLRINEPLVIVTSSLPDGYFGEPYNGMLTAAGGKPPYTWSGYPPQNLELDHSTGEVFGYPTTWGDVSFTATVRDSSTFQPPVHKSIPLKIIKRLRIRTSLLPHGRPGFPYRASLLSTGEEWPVTWRIVVGKLPDGLGLDASSGEISGNPTTAGNQSLTVRVEDSAQPPQFDERTLTLSILSSPGRNDSIATATPISNGSLRASLSPYAEPVDGPANPDTDYYVLTAMPGAVVLVETVAQQLPQPSATDTVLEIVDANGERLATCRDPHDYFGLYDKPCLNDDAELGYNLDSSLRLRLVSTPGTPVTFYVRVLDWRGDARPDFVYSLYVFGVN